MKATLPVIVLCGLLMVGPFGGAPRRAPGGHTPAGNAAAKDVSAARWRAAVATVVPGRTAPDPGSADPAAVRAFFAGLPAGQQDALARQDPAVVGNLDGAPVRLRYTANERRDPTSARVPGRLLGYDPGDGHAIVVLGDLTTARRVAVLVPGAGWRLDNLLGPDGSTGNHPLAAARSLFDEAYRIDPAAHVAVVVWLGYNPPAGVDLAAARSDRAIAGAAALRRFLAGLPDPVASPDAGSAGAASRRTSPGAGSAGAAGQVILLCHSYGAVVCGHAADSSTVTDLVAIAAPGMDVSTVDGLHTGARVWAARDAGDPIRFVPFVRVAGLGHGADPVDPGFGARVLRTGAARGHGGYFTPGTESLTNLARIVLGRTSAVTRADAA